MTDQDYVLLVALLCTLYTSYVWIYTAGYGAIIEAKLFADVSGDCNCILISVCVCVIRFVNV